MKSTLPSVWIPTAATVANNVSAAPPSTGLGIEATIAATLGRNPSRIMNTPAAATTQRLLIPVSRTSPTFSENAVYGNELKMPPMVVATPSARNMLPMFSALIRLPTISPVAMVDPVDSTAMISITIIMVRHATKSNFGMPNRNGGVNPTAAASPTRSKFMSPSA